MIMILRFIEEHFTAYSFVLILLCSYILIFIDRKQLKDIGVPKEGRFARVSGIVWAVVGTVFYIISMMAPIR